MKYLFINSVYGKGSTGKIIADKCHELIQDGHNCTVAYGRDAINDNKVELIRIGHCIDFYFHGFISRLFDRHGFCSKYATRRFLKRIKNSQFDVIWLHNLHGYYINIEMLFLWLKKNPQIKVFWTLHDCWAFTGHCAHFSAMKCNQWQSYCSDCPQLRCYPTCIGIGNVKNNFFRKKNSFIGVKDLTLVTPSQWLAELVTYSFLKDYPIKVCHNTINSEIFKPTPGNFREKYHMEKRFIVLGVANVWDEHKGLYDFYQLAEMLNNKYAVMLVGLSEKQIKKLPRNIIGITKINNQSELAEIYTAADVFVNPTHQDNFPTVNLEARACGTPVITYNVGGSPESAGGKYVVEENDIEGLVEMIRRLCCRRFLEE